MVTLSPRNLPIFPALALDSTTSSVRPVVAGAPTGARGGSSEAWASDRTDVLRR